MVKYDTGAKVCLEKRPIFETSLCVTAFCKYRYINQL